MLKSIYYRLVPTSIRVRLSRAKAAYLRNDEPSAHHVDWLKQGGPIKLLDFDLHPDDVVIDVGAYRGHWLTDMFTRHQCRIVAVEPIKEYANEITAKFHPNNKIDVHTIGLGASDRSEVIHVQGDASSTVRGTGTPSTIEIVDASKWLDQLSSDIALMAINCEGGEYEIVPRLVETGHINRIRYLLIQFHQLNEDSDGEVSHIRDSLSKTHRLVFSYPYVWELWARST
jgi:FkbM family methyltransferase